MARKKNIKYSQNYLPNLPNHVTHLNLLGIEKVSQNQIAQFTRASLSTPCLLSLCIGLLHKEV